MVPLQTKAVDGKPALPTTDERNLFVTMSLAGGWGRCKAVMTVVTLCDGNVTNRHDVTVNLSNMTVPLNDSILALSVLVH